MKDERSAFVSGLPAETFQSSEILFDTIQAAARNSIDEYTVTCNAAAENTDREAFKQRLITHEAGQLLGCCLKQARGPNEFITTVYAVKNWLVGCGPEVPQQRLGTSIPLQDVRKALFSRVLKEQVWVGDDNILGKIAESIVPLSQLSPDEPRGNVSEVFFSGMLRSAEMLLKSQRESTLHMPEMVRFFSALTDKGVFEEELWGKIAISGFTVNTPLAITHTLHQRYITEDRPSYASISPAGHEAVFKRYIHTVLRQTFSDSTRNQKITPVIADYLKLDKVDETRMRLNKVIAIANLITRLLNENGGVLDNEGKARQAAHLPEANSLTDDALNRILQATRLAVPHPRRDRQAYRDRLHVDIIEKMTPLLRYNETAL